MSLVFEAQLSYFNQMGSENRHLFTSLRKAYERLEKVHATSEWAEVPLPTLSDYRQQLKQFCTHTSSLLNKDDEEADFSISVRQVN